MSFLSGLSKAAVSYVTALTVSSCVTCELPPDGDVYLVRNMTSSTYLSCGVYGYDLGSEHFFDSGEMTPYQTYDDGCLRGDPGEVCVVISNRDSVIEVVPKLMAEGPDYSIFSGLEDWTKESYNVIELTVTDKTLEYVSDKMRSKGFPPYHIIKEDLINKMSCDIVISTLSAGAVLNTFRIAAGDSVALPEAGLLFDGDQYKVEAHGEMRVRNGCVVKVADCAASRNGEHTGSRRFTLTEDTWKYLLSPMTSESL